MKKIVTVVGARPQFIKAAPVSRRLREQLQEVLVHTGQHYDYNMADVFFEELRIPKPNYNLGVGSGSHGQQTGEILKKLEEVLFEEKPDAVLTYGDTNSTLAAALASSKLHIPLFHIEAGLRSFNKAMPEEINRVLTDHISDLLFAPTQTAVQNLKKEGILNGVDYVGDVMFDAFLFNLKIANEAYKINEFGLKKKEYILATIHRAENTDDPNRLKSIFESLADLNIKVVLPLHPRTDKRIKEYGMEGLLERSNTIQMIQPVSYLKMLFLQENASAVVTDSGGMQKEAYFARVPCITVRDQTEWVETVEAGWNTLFHPTRDQLQPILRKANPQSYVNDLYGDGNASNKIIERILTFFK